MKATDLLKMQHEEVKSLFSSIERAHGKKEKGELWEKLAATLVAHDAIEREIFYPACEEKMGMNKRLGEALVEHGLVEFSLLRCDQNAGGDSFDYFLMVLKEVVLHHVDEEEKEFLPEAWKALGEGRLANLGEEMEERFAEAMSEDFRAALMESMRDVLAGSMKTGEDAEVTVPKRKPPAPRTTRRTTKQKKTTNGRSTHHAHR